MLRRVVSGGQPWHGLDVGEIEGTVVAQVPVSPLVDTVPVSLAEVAYEYLLLDDVGAEVAWATTSLEAWPEALVPRVHLPSKPEWVAIYRAAWALTWQRIVTSQALPERFAYNDYPDNRVTYVWDSCFSTLFQRYAAPAGAHPCMKTLDNFYASQAESGHIARNFRVTDFAPQWGAQQAMPTTTGINPPLFAWAEWGYYLFSADVERLRQVLPRLVQHYDLIEGFMQEKPGYYLWTGSGSGWDNINWGQGEDAIYYWVEVPAMQAMVAHYVTRIAGVLGEFEIACRFEAEFKTKRIQLEPYWNEAASWYCSLTRDGRFTRKTLCGMWPFVAGIVDKGRAGRIVRKTLMNPDCFLTEPMPLPVLAKGEPGYNPKGEYWLGAAWVNISLMVIRGLERYGFKAEAVELAARTLDAIARVYVEWDQFPHTLWECYAPEFPAPASHKEQHPDRLGTVRHEFGGWTCRLINLLIENVMGLQVNAPDNALAWDLRLADEHGVENLRFGSVTTDLHVTARPDPGARAEVWVRSDAPYTLRMTVGERLVQYDVPGGESRFWV